MIENYTPIPFNTPEIKLYQKNLVTDSDKSLAITLTLVSIVILLLIVVFVIYKLNQTSQIKEDHE